jgi:hypothetical protein
VISLVATAFATASHPFGAPTTPNFTSSPSVRHVSARAVRSKRSGAPLSRSARWGTSLGPPAAVVPLARASRGSDPIQPASRLDVPERPVRASAASLQRVLRYFRALQRSLSDHQHDLRVIRHSSLRAWPSLPECLDREKYRFFVKLFWMVTHILDQHLQSLSRRHALRTQAGMAWRDIVFSIASTIPMHSPTSKALSMLAPLGKLAALHPSTSLLAGAAETDKPVAQSTNATDKMRNIR